MSWVTSCRFPPVSETASGLPCRSTIRWCSLPGRARSTGEGPVRAPLIRAVGGSKSFVQGLEPLHAGDGCLESPRACEASSKSGTVTGNFVG